MKILYVNTSCGYGSTGKIVSDLYNLAKEKNYEAKVAYAYYSRYVPDDDTYRVNNKIDYYLHNILSRLTDRAGFFSTIPTLKFLRYIKREKPDIIHLHNIHGYYLNIILLFRYLVKIQIPVIITMHDCWTLTGHCAYFDSVNCTKWKSQCNNCELKRSYPMSYFFDCSRSNFNIKKSLLLSINSLTMVPVSDWLGKITKESFLKNSRIKVIKNGIDLAVFRPRPSNLRKQLNIEESKIVVLGVAAPWSERKGLRDFYSLAKNYDFQVIMVGLTRDQLKDLPKEIIGIERTNNQEELAEFYTMADIYVNTTYSDNYPTTNIEALACGTPVITYNTGGSIEPITPLTGRIVEQGNIVNLTNSIYEVYKTKSLFECRKYAKEHADKTKCFEKYFELYYELIK